MSRLHDALTKGLDAVPSMPHWAPVFPTMADRLVDLKSRAIVSPRAGTRTKTKRKTALACGRRFCDPRSWRVRHSGISSVKSQKARDFKKAKKNIREQARGDAKRT